MSAIMALREEVVWGDGAEGREWAGTGPLVVGNVHGWR